MWIRIKTSWEQTDTRLGREEKREEKEKELSQAGGLRNSSSHQCNPRAQTPWDQQNCPSPSVGLCLTWIFPRGEFAVKLH